MEITLRDLRKKSSGLFQKIINLTNYYSIPIIYPTRQKVDSIQPFNGSGTFCTIGNRYGILTNNHVMKIVIDEDEGHVYLPYAYPQTGLLAIKRNYIIALPEMNTSGLDLAFIEIQENEVKKISAELGKKFWNLNSSYDAYLRGGFCECKEQLNRLLWLTHGYSSYGRELKNDGNVDYWEYPYGGPYFLGVKDIEFKYYQYPQLLHPFLMDKLSCSIDREMNYDIIPDSFNGMSGAAVWQVQVGQDESLCINLAGIMVEEKPFGKDFSFHELTFYGAATLYKSFFPFAFTIFNQIL